MKDQNKLLKKCLVADIPAIVFQGTDKCAVEILQAAAEIYKKNGCSEEFLFDFEQLIKNFEGYQVENSTEIKVPTLNDSEKEVVRMDMKATSVHSKLPKEIKDFRENLESTGFMLKDETFAQYLGNKEYMINNTAQYIGIVAQRSSLSDSYKFVITHDKESQLSNFYIHSLDPKYPVNLESYYSFKTCFADIMQNTQMQATSLQKDFSNYNLKEDPEKKTHQDDFKKWAKDNNIKIFNTLSEATTKFDKELVVGQKCTFINDYGVKFDDLTIMGFCEQQNNIFTGEDTGRYVYLDKDSYWFPVNPHSIVLEKNAANNIQNEKHPNAISNKELYSSGSRTLIGDFSAGKDSQITNLRIRDNSTGKTESLQIKGINLDKEYPETIKKILSGAKTNTSSGLAQLSKSATGWGITIVKQAFSTTDAAAGI